MKKNKTKNIFFYDVILELYNFIIKIIAKLIKAWIA